MKKLHTVLILLSVLAALPLWADEGRIPIYGPPGQPFPITISQPGYYILTRNLNVTSGNAIVIASDNVTLDLNGQTIGSTVSTAGYAVSVSAGLPHSGIRVTNGKIVRFEIAVNAYNASSGSQYHIDHLEISGGQATAIRCGGVFGITNAVVENNVISNYLGSGITFESVNGAIIADNIVQSGNLGISLLTCVNTQVTGNVVTNSNYGIRVDTSYNNQITRNTASNNANNGIFLRASNHNIVSYNLVAENFGNQINLDAAPTQIKSRITSLPGMVARAALP